MAYWSTVAARAFRQARKDCKVDTGVGIVVLLATQALIALAVFLATADLIGNLTTRISSTAVPFLLLPALWIYRCFTEPSVMANEQNSKIAALQAENSSPIARREYFRSALLPFYTRLGDLYTELASVTQDEDIPSFSGRVSDLINETGAWIQANMGMAAWNKFKTPAMAAYVTWAGEHSQEAREQRSNLLLALDRFKTNLEPLLQTGHWDPPSTPPPPT